MLQRCIPRSKEGGNGIAAIIRMVMYSATRMNRTAAKIRHYGKFTLAVRDRKSPAFARRSDKERKTTIVTANIAVAKNAR
jgi:hypothetical protein